MVRFASRSDVLRHPESTHKKHRGGDLPATQQTGRLWETVDPLTVRLYCYAIEISQHGTAELLDVSTSMVRSWLGKRTTEGYRMPLEMFRHFVRLTCDAEAFQEMIEAEDLYFKGSTHAFEMAVLNHPAVRQLQERRMERAFAEIEKELTAQNSA